MDASGQSEELYKPSRLPFREGHPYHPDVHLYEGDKAFEGLPDDFVKLPARGTGECTTQNYGVPFGEHKTLKDSRDPSKPAVVYLITAINKSTTPTFELSAQFRMWGPKRHRNVRPSDITDLKHDRFDPLKTPLAGYDARTGECNKEYNRRWPMNKIFVIHKHWLARYWMWLFKEKFPDEFSRWQDNDSRKEMLEKVRAKLVTFDEIDDPANKGEIEDVDSDDESGDAEDDESDFEGPRVVLRSQTRSRAEIAPTIGNGQDIIDTAIPDAELEDNVLAQHHQPRDKLKELLQHIDESDWATYHVHVPKPKQEDVQKLRKLRKVYLQHFDQFRETISGERAQAEADGMEMS